jgi:uncharacterized Zn finger protein
MSWYYGFRPYVPVAQRRAKAAAYAAKLAKKEKRPLAPVKLEGRTIAASFWGKAWCENLERYSDFENRLPRGRSYVRNGSVIDLQIKHGEVRAIVSGSEVYRVSIDIKTLSAAVWARIKKDCARTIDSLMDLLQGRFDQGIMQRLSQRDGGLFPQPKEIKMNCTCPDWAGMCKHVAATLYGVGARLDKAPELLFTLRDVDHLELISQAIAAENLNEALEGRAEVALAKSDLGEIFGIDLDVSGSARTEASSAEAGVPSTTPQDAKTRPRANKKAAAVPAKRKKPLPIRGVVPVGAAPKRSLKLPPKGKRRVRPDVCMSSAT